MNENEKKRKNPFDDQRIKKDAEGANEPYNRDKDDIEGEFHPRFNNPDTMLQSTMPTSGSSQGNMEQKEQFYLNINFDKNIVDDEQRLLNKYQKIIDALENVSDLKGRETNDREFEALVRKIDEAINYHDTTLNVSESQLSYLSMSLRYIKDPVVREKLENAIEQVKKEHSSSPRRATDTDNIRTGERETGNRRDPDMMPPSGEEQPRTDSRTDSDDEGPVI